MPTISGVSVSGISAIGATVNYTLSPGRDQVDRIPALDMRRVRFEYHALLSGNLARRKRPADGSW